MRIRRIFILNMKPLFQIPLLALIAVITIIHANKFARNEKIGPWWHFWWGFVYGLPAVIFAYFCRSWWLLGAFMLERFVFYNPMLNIWRHKYFFYIVASNSKPGFWDKIELWWKGFYPYIWCAGVIAYIVVQFFI